MQARPEEFPDEASFAQVQPGPSPEKVAIIHDWLPEIGGAEKVLAELLKVFPRADLFSLIDFIPAGERAFLQGHAVQTTFLQRLPGIRKFYRSCLPVMPLAVEHIDLGRYSLILSSSYAVAKGVITGPDQLHLCYCHSPIRYAWDLQEHYLAQSGNASGLRGFMARALLHYVRIWDTRTSNGVDAFAANSRFVARRIWKVYRRKSRVIYPPVEIASPGPSASKPGNFFVSLGRLVPYKRVDLIVEAFRRMPQHELVVIGEGPERASLERNLPRNVSLLGRLPQNAMLNLLREARGMVFAAEEDFGIAPVEAQALGTPVIALGKGGALETVRDLQTGVLFPDQTVDSLLEAVKKFENLEWRSERLRAQAERFSPERFRLALGEWARGQWQRFIRGKMRAPSR
jgi:glycosyltransferase involved in cell wall biosynthesis